MDKTALKILSHQADNKMGVIIVKGMPLQERNRTQLSLQQISLKINWLILNLRLDNTNLTTIIILNRSCQIVEISVLKRDQINRNRNLISSRKMVNNLHRI
jgi:hypothetical protein